MFDTSALNSVYTCSTSILNDNQTLNSLFFNENLLSLLLLNTSIHSFAKKKKKSATFDEFKTDHLLRSRKKSKRLKGDVSSDLK